MCRWLLGRCKYGAASPAATCWGKELYVVPQPEARTRRCRSQWTRIVWKDLGTTNSNFVVFPTFRWKCFAREIQFIAVRWWWIHSGKLWLSNLFYLIICLQTNCCWNIFYHKREICISYRGRRPRERSLIVCRRKVKKKRIKGTHKSRVCEIFIHKFNKWEICVSNS